MRVEYTAVDLSVGRRQVVRFAFLIVGVLALAGLCASASAEVISVWPTCTKSRKEVCSPAGIAASASGDVYVVDNRRRGPFIVQFSEAGKFVRMWPLRTKRASETAVPSIDQQGNVFVPAGRTIEKYSSTGTSVTAWQATADAAQTLVAVTIAPDGSPYALSYSRSGSIVVHLDQSGNVLASWPVKGAAEELLAVPTSIAVGANGIVFVESESFEEETTLLRFSPTGTPLGPMSLPKPVAEDMTAVAGDAFGFIYVIGGTEIDRYTDGGAPAGRQEFLEGFDFIYGAVAADGDIYAAAPDDAGPKGGENLLAHISAITGVDVVSPQVTGFTIRASHKRQHGRGGSTLARQLDFMLTVSEPVEGTIKLRYKRPHGRWGPFSPGEFGPTLLFSKTGRQHLRLAGRFPAGKYRVVSSIQDYAGNKVKPIVRRLRIAGRPPASGGQSHGRQPAANRAERYLQCIQDANGNPKKVQACIKYLR